MGNVCNNERQSYDLESRKASQSQTERPQAEDKTNENNALKQAELNADKTKSLKRVPTVTITHCEDDVIDPETGGNTSRTETESENSSRTKVMSSDEFKPGHISQPAENKAGHSGHASTSEKMAAMSEEDATQVVRRCWEKIEEGCQDEMAARPGIHAAGSGGWKVVRLFVSSTFTDYHAERELLVKKVFPELREWCEHRRVQLIECDLRWGVPKYSSTEMTIKTCLGEIDKCKEETDGVPFFLNMLGERYGWMPGESDVPNEIQKGYDWVFPASITHMEILHAAYRNKNPNAAFMIRDPAFLDEIPTDMKGAFIDNSVLSKAQLQMLKEKLRLRFPGQVFDYNCEYTGIDKSTGKPKVCLRALDDFGNRVLEVFKAAIEMTFPVVEKELTLEQTEAAAHDSFVRSRGALLLGRHNEVKQVMEYITREHEPLGNEESDSRPIMLVQGVPGSGKSSLVAYCTLEAKKLDSLLFYHFVGSGPGSTSPLRVVNRLFAWLRDITHYTGHKDTNKEHDDENDDEDLSMDLLKKHLKNVLNEAGKLNKKVVIIIDALNQLADADHGSSHLDWLQTGCPSNVRVIVSAVESSRSVRMLINEDRKPCPCEVYIEELDETSRKEMVQHLLGIYNKKLDQEQLDMLVSMEGAANPLWLSLACEELRVFGVFERVTDHIKSLPEYLKGLLEFILKRFIDEDEFRNVEKVLSVLGCAGSGLDEQELRWILSEDPDQQLPMMQWAVVRRTLKPFLRRTNEYNQEERVDFFHASISQIAKDSLLGDVKQKQEWHKRIADYFQYKSKSDSRASEIIPDQLKQAGDKKRLLGFLRNDVRAQRRNSVWKNQYYKFLLCGQIIPQSPAFSEEVTLCHMCSMQHRGLGQIAGLNKDCCVICGAHVPFKQDKHIAMLCQKHKPFVAPGHKKCFICERPAFGNTHKGYTCMVCTSYGIKKCIKCVV